MATQNPQIRIPDLYLELKEFREEVNEKIGELRRSFSNYTTFIIGVLVLGFIILLFAFGTLLVQVVQFYLTFQNQYNEVNIQGNIIQNNVKNEQSIIKSQQSMQKELDEIKNKLPTNTPSQ